MIVTIIALTVISFALGTLFGKELEQYLVRETIAAYEAAHGIIHADLGRAKDFLDNLKKRVHYLL